MDERLKWCHFCGEGVTTFCRGKRSPDYAYKCAMGFKELGEPQEGVANAVAQNLRATDFDSPFSDLQKSAHTDHPSRHWDRTCPACKEEVVQPVRDAELQGWELVGWWHEAATEEESDFFPAIYCDRAGDDCPTCKPLYARKAAQ